ncbi:MAG TPA: hypothetical protein EYP85_16765 [Armatimonadetes bacterium]|nr:hypothetical protein [Armatimonadota bacterium]
MKEAFDLTEYWRFVRRRKAFLLLPVLLLPLMTLLGAMVMPRIYLLKAQVIVREEQEPLEGMAVEARITQQLGGIVTIIRSPSSQTQIARQLLKEWPEKGPLIRLLEDFQDHLLIREKREEREVVIEIAYLGTPQEYVAAVVNAFADAIVEQGTQLIRAALQQSIEFVEEQLRQYQKKLRQLDEEEQQLKTQMAEQLGEEAPISSLEGLRQFVSRQLAQDEAELRRLRLELMAARSQKAALEAQLERLEPVIEEVTTGRANLAVANIEGQLAETRAELAAQLKLYTEKHPRIIELQAKIEELEKQLEETRRQTEETGERKTTPNPAYVEVQDKIRAAEGQIAYLSTQEAQVRSSVEKWRRIVPQLPAFEQQLKRITEERTAYQERYSTLLDRHLALTINQQFEESRDTGRFQVHRPGNVPRRPVSPNPKKLAVFSLLGGLVIGVSFALLAEYFDHSVRTTEDLHRYLDAEVLAVLPRLPL